MTAIVNGVQYIGGQTSPDEFIKIKRQQLTNSNNR